MTHTTVTERKRPGPATLIEPAARVQQGPGEAYVRLLRAKIAADPRLRED